MADPATWALAAATLIGAGASTAASVDAEHTAAHAQRVAQGKAEEEQRKADIAAETQRLEGLKTAATKTDYGDIWGTSTNKYADAAQKLSAGTGSFNTDDDETNPFYTKGLL